MNEIRHKLDDSLPASMHPLEAASEYGPEAQLDSNGCEKSDIQDLMKDLPPHAEYDLFQEELRHMPTGNKDQGWQNSLKLVEKYDRDLCQAYREQIDTLLVFAGLFSAVVTAFAIESYQWLQDDPVETSVELLRDMVDLLLQNMNRTAFPPPSTGAHISEAAVVRINVLWFLSLTLSLSAALAGILTKQWLREYERDVGQSPETALAVRHIRFRGLEYWRVGTIVSSVPLMLQVALAFFLTGILDLLWQLHATVASFITAVAGLTLVFYLLTTFLPLIQYAYICLKCCARPERVGDYVSLAAFTEPQCAFKSTQAWLVMSIVQPLIDRAFNAYTYGFKPVRSPRYQRLVLRPADSWVTFDLNWMKRHKHVHLGPQYAYEALAWIAGNLEETNSSTWLWHCVWGRWLIDRETLDSMAVAARDIGCVARAFPDLPPLSLQITAPARAQAMVFQCTLRNDLPINTALELILRVAPKVGVGSHWTRRALAAVCEIYRGLQCQLSDDISMGLFHLCELLTPPLMQWRVTADSDTPDGAWAVRHVLLLLHRGSRLRHHLIPAISGLAYQWLSANPVGEFADAAAGINAVILLHYTYSPSSGERLRSSPGVTLTAKFCYKFAELWPQFCIRLYSYDPYYQDILGDLLVIASASCGREPVAAVLRAFGLYQEFSDRAVLEVQGDAS